MTATTPPTQASDEQPLFDEKVVIAEQVKRWRAEIRKADQLKDLIAFATGVQASDEPMRAVVPCVWWDRAIGGFYLSESSIPAGARSEGRIVALVPAALLAAEKRKTLELQRVYDERGLQIGRLETALARATKGAKP